MMNIPSQQLPPKTVILEVKPYWDIISEALAPFEVNERDFQELFTQVAAELLNYRKEVVLKSIGREIPQVNRMTDTSYANDPVMYEKLCNAMFTLINYTVADFNSMGLFSEDGTLSYGVMKFKANVVLLDYFPY